MCSYDIWSTVFARGMTLTIVEWSRKMKKKILVVSQDLKHNPKVSGNIPNHSYFMNETYIIDSPVSH